MGSHRRENDVQWIRRVFSDARAREAADRAIDALDVSMPMSAFLDAWVAAYKAAGGQTQIGD